MTWGVETSAVEALRGRGCVRKTRFPVPRTPYVFNFAGTPVEFVDAFLKYYGPTMNAYDAAGEEFGRAGDLRKELEALFTSQNKSPGTPVSSIPATFLRVTVVT